MTRFEIHSHTMYSNIRFLDSINTPKALIDRAVELELSGIAITDHGCLCALPEAYKYVQEKILPAHPDFKFALGDESYLVDKRDKNIQYYHFILIAKDKIGWRMLRELSSYSWMQSYFDRGMERVPTTKEELVNKIKKYGKGHLIASSACLAGEVNSNVLDLTKAEKAGNQEKILELKGNIDKFIRFCIDCFGDDFYLECAPGTSADQIAVNRRLPSIAKAYNRKIIIGTDAHYLKKEDRDVHKGYLNSKQAEREVDSFYEFAYLQNEEEIKENLKPSGLNYDELVRNSEEIYNKIQVYEIRHKQQIPTVDVKDYPKKDALAQYPHLHELYMSDDKQNRYWVNQCVDALKDKKLYNDTYLKRLDEEADVKQVIGKKLETNMFSYPVTLQHYVDMFWECDSTIGAGRGCFLPDSKVLLSTGKVKNIQDMEKGDFVLTQKGQSREVLDCLKYPCHETIYQITPATSTHQPISCTNNHEFWVMRGGPCGIDRQHCSLNCSRQCRKRASFKKQWVRADKLTTEDFLFYPRPIFKEKTIQQFDLTDYIEDKSHYVITDKTIISQYGKGRTMERFIPVNKEFLYVLGVAIGDGWTILERDKSCIGIAFNSSTEKDLASLDRCKKYFRSLGDITVTPQKHEQKNLIQLYVYSKPLAVLFRSLIGHKVENKQIPERMLYNNKEEMLSLLEGLLASDGSYDKTALRISYDGINYSLICQIKMLLAYLGIFASITTRPAHGNNQESYKLRAGGAQLNWLIDRFPLLYQKPSKVQTNLIVQEDGFYTPIKDISTKEYNGFVYDLTVDQDHCYIINNISVHNSSCSGLNHYLLGVTQLDPIKWNLPFFRYLNKERIELGDIDIDISPSRRPEILRRIKAERGARFNSEIDDLSRQNLGCTLVATFGTESTRSTVLSACRGYRSEDFPKGIDVDEAQYMSSLIPQERGFVWDLEDVVYGNQDKGREPVIPFIDEVNNYPGLLDIMFGIQGLVKQRGSHASGVIFFDKDPYEFAAFMKTPSGDIITQWDLEMDEMLGMTKFDFLVTDVQDKIVTTIKLLQRNKEIDPSLSLRQVYEKYLSPDVLPLDDPKIWDALDNGTVLNVFQFDSQVGSQAAKKIRPRTVEEMSDANGLLRLMTQEKGAESPMDKYVRFKKDISLWYKEMDAAGLTKTEQKTLEPYFKSSYGVPPSQEQLMLMLMDPNVCHFSLKDANDARKIVGKKQMNRIPTLHQKVLDQAKSPALGKYVWEYGAGPQMGYSFSRIHSIAYSFVGVQTLYLATHFNPIYWDCACLIVNSGAISGGSPNYAKIAKAIGEIQSAGVKIALVDINKSDLTFTPNPTNNTILYGLKGILNVGDDIVQDTIDKRPYVSIKDYYNKVHPNKQAMISLIKGGAFDAMEDRKFAMAWFIWETCDKKKKLTLSNLSGLIKHNLMPERTEEDKTARRVFEFNRYLKKVCANSNKDIYILDARAIDFLTEMGYENLIHSKDSVAVMGAKDWNAKYQKWMEVLRNWLNENKDEVLDNLNKSIFLTDWDKYAQGTYSDWEMAALCFYYHPHVLTNVNNERYGFEDFAQLPKEPVIEDTYNIHGHTVNIFKIARLAGTCIAKDKMHHTISLLTTSGVVNIKFVKDQFAYFDKQISQRNPDGTKTVVEKSWFTRGNLLIVQGIRSGDTFMCKKYSRTAGHRLAKITRVNSDNSLEIQEERAQGDYEDEE